MRIVITGAAGFIGSHLVEKCLSLGHEVLALDNLSTGSLENLAGPLRHPRFRFTCGDASSIGTVALLVDRCDAIFHLAAAVGVQLVVESSTKTIETNVNCSDAMLKCAVKNRTRLILTSTSEVYGKNTRVPFVETDDLLLGPPTRGRWSYACSKPMDEFLALAYWKEFGVPTTIVRLFNTIGPRQSDRYGMVLPTFIKRALNGEDILVYGDGQQTRCFVHVEDVVLALIRLIDIEASYGQIYNVGSTYEMQIYQLAKMVCRRVGIPYSRIEFIPYDQIYGKDFEDMPRRVPDISKIYGLFGWRAVRSTVSIVDEVIAHYQGRTPGCLHQQDPTTVKRVCERLALSSWPAIANHAKYPAVNWFTFAQLREFLHDKGFESLDRFDLVNTSEKGHWPKAYFA